VLVLLLALLVLFLLLVVGDLVVVAGSSSISCSNFSGQRRHRGPVRCAFYLDDTVAVRR
jgi:hypothetical protein